MNITIGLATAGTIGLLCVSLSAQAGVNDDVGYTALATELGASLPDGSGVDVSHVEASVAEFDHDGIPETPGLPTYMPNPADAQFTGKTITDKTGTTLDNYSGHATGAGRRFYGNTSSFTPGISSIDSYNAVDWLGDGFIQAGTGLKPLVSSSRVGNHSWIGSADTAADNSDILRRVDWVVERDEFILAVGVSNGSTNPALLSSAYNVIAVGTTDGGHGKFTAAVDADYIGGRVSPDIVAPFTTTSAATPVVASAAALLVDLGHNNPGLSTDPVSTSTTNRNGDTIRNAERAEVIKAALMAGAQRVTSNTTPADITDFRALPANQSDNGLDTRFGAGQLNIQNSFHIIAAGEQNSDEDDIGGTGAIDLSGFDYDPSFGGAGGSNSAASYRFSTTSLANFTATLAWNIEIDGGVGPLFSGDASLYDLDLLLFDVTGSALLLADSTSAVENTENIWTSLQADRDYLLQVVLGEGQAPFEWDYALAWQVTAVPVPAALPLMLSGLFGLGVMARRRR